MRKPYIKNRHDCQYVTALCTAFDDGSPASVTFEPNFRLFADPRLALRAQRDRLTTIRRRHHARGMRAARAVREHVWADRPRR